MLTCSSATWILTERDRKQLNIFGKEVYRRNLGPVYDNEKQNWRILTNKEIYAIVKKTYYNRDNRLNRLRRFGHVRRKKIEFPKEYYI